jgi:hypothetical protein
MVADSTGGSTVQRAERGDCRSTIRFDLRSPSSSGLAVKQLNNALLPQRRVHLWHSAASFSGRAPPASFPSVSAGVAACPALSRAGRALLSSSASLEFAPTHDPSPPASGCSYSFLYLRARQHVPRHLLSATLDLAIGSIVRSSRAAGRDARPHSSPEACHQPLDPADPADRPFGRPVALADILELSPASRGGKGAGEGSPTCSVNGRQLELNATSSASSPARPLSLQAACARSS